MKKTIMFLSLLCLAAPLAAHEPSQLTSFRMNLPVDRSPINFADLDRQGEQYTDPSGLSLGQHLNFGRFKPPVYHDDEDVSGRFHPKRNGFGVTARWPF